MIREEAKGSSSSVYTIRIWIRIKTNASYHLSRYIGYILPDFPKRGSQWGRNRWAYSMNTNNLDAVAYGTISGQCPCCGEPSPASLPLLPQLNGWPQIYDKDTNPFVRGWVAPRVTPIQGDIENMEHEVVDNTRGTEMVKE